MPTLTAEQGHRRAPVFGQLRLVLALARQHGPLFVLDRLVWKVRGQRGFAPMRLARRYCRGMGIELGASASNPFNLPGARNCAPYSADPSDPDHGDFEIYREEQVRLGGAWAPVDLVGEADAIPVPDGSQDYVLSSHVVEHVPDLISAFLEWNRVLRPGGIVFMIFPKRDALPLDASRPVTPLEEFIEDYRTRQTLHTHPIPPGERVRGHYHVFTLESMLALIDWCNRELGLSWEVLCTEQTDSKVGNGHTAVCRRR